MPETAHRVRVRPYADHLEDGILKVSFTVPLAHGPSAHRAALEIAAAMGLERTEVTHVQELTAGFTYFVLYGRFPGTVEMVPTEHPAEPPLAEDEIEDHLARRIGRPIVVVGASTGTDAHSVGIDAILNLKGYHGHRGLEGFRGFVVHNLGSQVPNEQLLAKAVAVRADAILISQTVTQQALHIPNLTEFADLAEAQRIRDRVVLVCGGPSMTRELAKELGFDAGFGRGTLPSELAGYLVAELAARLEQGGGRCS